MQDIIRWCNDNNGFLTAILSVIGLFLSIIAIVVSIKTARLPFKKKIVISFSTKLWVGTNPLTNTVASGVQGISINVVNKGFRDVNITYLGLLLKDNHKKQQLYKTKEHMDGVGIIHPSEVHTNYFESDNISKYFNTTSPTYYFDESTKLVHVSNNRYYFEISNISARKLRSNYSLSIYTGKIITKIYDDGSSYEYNESVKLNFSPLSYVYSALAQYGNSLNEKDINLCNTVRALYLYSYASYNYFWG